MHITYAYNNDYLYIYGQYNVYNVLIIIFPSVFRSSIHRQHNMVITVGLNRHDAVCETFCIGMKPYVGHSV